MLRCRSRVINYTSLVNQSINGSNKLEAIGLHIATSKYPQLTMRTTTRPQNSSPLPDRKNRRKAARLASERIASQARLVARKRARARSQQPEETSDEDTTPSLSRALDMPKFKNLEIVDSEGSLQEVLEEGDW